MKQLLATLGFVFAFLMANAADYSQSMWVGESHTFSIKKEYYYTNAYCDYWWNITFSNPSSDYLSISEYVPPLDGTITLSVTVKKYFTGTKTITMNYIREYGMPGVPSGTFHDNCSKTFAISCKKANVSIEPSSVELEIGQTQQLSYSFSPSGSNPPATIQSFTTSNSQVAKVTSSGLVTAVGAGQASIKATTNYDTYDYCYVTVLAIPATGISLNKSSMTLLSGSSRRLSATVTPSNASTKIVTWSSSNPAVLTVDQYGNINAIKAGVATITASSSDGTNLSASCKVTIYEGDVDGNNVIDVSDVINAINVVLNITN